MRVSLNNCSYNKPLYNPNFQGIKVSLIDAGEHGEDVLHFAKAVLPKEAELSQIFVKLNENAPALKQIRSLFEAVKEINLKPKSEKPEFLAMPILIPIQLKNLSAQMSSVTNSNVNLTAANVKPNKESILEFLKEISINPKKYLNELQSMDRLGLEMEYTYPLIQEINKAVKSGIKVFVPTGHPEHQVLRCVIRNNRSEAEMFKFLSTGEDVKSTVKKASQEVKRIGGYEFNLISLSDAEVVNVLDANKKLNIFSAYDNFDTTSARGMYNLYPVRDNGKVVGFSYTDKVTNQYPLNEVPYRQHIEPLYRFVGLKPKNVVASDKMHVKLLKYMKNPLGVSKKEKESLNKKLYDTTKLFDIHEIYNKKMNMKGRYVSSDLKLFFRKNKEGEITFPNCNYERSERPSVKSMVGSCFSLCNALAEEIAKVIK